MDLNQHTRAIQLLPAGAALWGMWRGPVAGGALSEASHREAPRPGAIERRYPAAARGAITGVLACRCATRRRAELAELEGGGLT